MFSHEYDNSNLQTISINSESLTYFSPYDTYYDKKGVFRELRFGDCPELIEIKCYNKILTALEIKGCTALTSLDCRSNQLTSLNISGCRDRKSVV